MSNEPTPGSKTMPKIQSENAQGQGSAYKPTTPMFQPKVSLENWPPQTHPKER